MIRLRESESVVDNSHPAAEACKKRNVCGECQACCWLYTIAEMEKPRMTQCRHQCEAGCGIHDRERPPICTGFQCAWLHEGWAPELRPDRSRIIWQDRGLMPDRWGRLHQVWLGNMLDRSAYLRRANERWCDHLVVRNKIVYLQYIDSDPEVEEILCMKRCSEIAFPGLRARDVFRHICAVSAANNSENVARQMAFMEKLQGGLS